MGSTNCEKDPISVLKEAAAGGITMFQFREKGLNCLHGKARYTLARSLQHVCRAHKIPFIVNDDVELALALNADGVHIGQEDDSVEDVRKKIGEKILGVSVHHVEEAKRAKNAGADYIGVGPMFHTSTKSDCRDVQGPSVIRSIRKAGIELPLVGIGGIHAGNASQVLRAGADGIAVISAICKNPPDTIHLLHVTKENNSST